MRIFQTGMMIDLVINNKWRIVGSRIKATLKTILLIVLLSVPWIAEAKVFNGELYVPDLDRRNGTFLIDVNKEVVEPLFVRVTNPKKLDEIVWDTTGINKPIIQLELFSREATIIHNGRKMARDQA